MFHFYGKIFELFFCLDVLYYSNYRAKVNMCVE